MTSNGLLNLNAILFVISAVTMGCHKHAVSNVEQVNLYGLEDVFLYNTTVARNFFDDPTANNMASNIAALASRPNGAVSSIQYTRDLTFEPNSPWVGLARYRANSYSAALDLVRKSGDSSPVLISVSQIQSYFSYNDNLWYPALETALNHNIPGTGLGRGKLATQILSDTNGQPNEVLTSILQKHQSIWDMNQSQLYSFWQLDPFQFKPLSFYVGDDLSKIWISDRLLLNESEELYRSDKSQFNRYYASGAVGARMLKSLRSVFSHIANHADPAVFTDSGISDLINSARISFSGFGSTLWPPSSPGVLERLPPEQRLQYDARAEAQPPMDAIVTLIKNGQLSLQPRGQDGFLIYQRYALEPLLTFSKLPEGELIHPSKEIAAIWEETYKSSTANIQNTQQKVIDTGGAGSGSGPISQISQVRLWIEPLPSFYLREYQAYNFLSQYIKTLPRDFLDQWIVDNESATIFIDKLTQQALSLYVLCARQMGVAYDPAVVSSIVAHGEQRLLSEASTLLTNLQYSPAMNTDQRVFAVQGRPGGPKSLNCLGKDATFWATLGIEAVPVHVSSNAWTNEGSGPFPTQVEGDMIVLINHFNEFNLCVSQPLAQSEWQSLLKNSNSTRELLPKLLEY